MLYESLSGLLSCSLNVALIGFSLNVALIGFPTSVDLIGLPLNVDLLGCPLTVDLLGFPLHSMWSREGYWNFNCKHSNSQPLGILARHLTVLPGPSVAGMPTTSAKIHHVQHRHFQRRLVQSARLQGD